MTRSRVALFATLALMLAVTSAVAAGAPTATTGPGSATSDTTATVGGGVDPNGQATTYAFQYGTSASYGLQSATQSAGAGTSPVPESASLTGLRPGTTYHFRIIATNASGTATGSDATFTTSGTAPASTTPPTVTTGSASGVTTSGATLSGGVNPNGHATTYRFEYGRTSAYGTQTSSQSAGSGTTSTNVSTAVSGLQPATTYHYRLVAVNSAGQITTGSDRTFTTATPPPVRHAPTVSTSSASSVHQTSATVHGGVNPNGQSTTYAFQYGPTSGYGLQSPTRSAGSGSSSVNVAATLTSLRPGTTYHYRLIATNATGTSVGSDRTFRTAGVPPPRKVPPSATTLPATRVTVHSAVLHGVVVPGNSTTTYTFEIGASPAYGLQTTPRTLAASNFGRTVSASVFRLQANRTYHYRLVATNAGGTTLGRDRTFYTGGRRPRRLTATTTPRRARHVPYAFTTRGRLFLPRGMGRAEGCRGVVTIRFRRGARTVSFRRVPLNGRCTYRSHVVFRRAHLKPGALRVFVRFLGNVVLRPRSARTQTVRVG